MGSRTPPCTSGGKHGAPAMSQVVLVQPLIQGRTLHGNTATSKLDGLTPLLLRAQWRWTRGYCIACCRSGHGHVHTPSTAAAIQSGGTRFPTSERSAPASKTGSLARCRTLTDQSQEVKSSPLRARDAGRQLIG
jgi:hypothetical protein